MPHDLLIIEDDGVGFECVEDELVKRLLKGQGVTLGGGLHEILHVQERAARFAETGVVAKGRLGL